jgi:hypothetical protein
MADRGRDLKFSILSDVSQFDLAEPARQLDDLGRGAQDAQRGLSTFGRDARTTARDVAASFDAIPRAATPALGGLSGTASKAMGGVRRIFKREGKAAAADLVSSFAGASDLGGVASSMAVTLPSLFGPVGVAIGGLLATGLAFFTKAWSENKAKIEKDTQDLFNALVEGQGRVDQAFIQSKVKQFVSDGTYDQLAAQARDAKVSVDDLVLAHAGDEAALSRVRDQLATNEAAIRGHITATWDDKNAQDAALLPLQKVAGGLREQASASDKAKSAYDRLRETVDRPLSPVFNGGPAEHAYDAFMSQIRATAAQGVTVHVGMDTSAAYQAFRQMERDFANRITRSRP